MILEPLKETHFKVDESLLYFGKRNETKQNETIRRNMY